MATGEKGEMIRSFGELLEKVCNQRTRYEFVLRKLLKNHGQNDDEIKRTISAIKNGDLKEITVLE